MYTIVAHVRPNKDCPYSDYLAEFKRSGAKKDEAKILAAVERLRNRGAQELAQIALAKKMNDVWELRPKSHRIFFFFDSGRQTYVLLIGKYLSSLRKLDHVIAPKEGFETQL